MPIKQANKYAYSNSQQATDEFWIHSTDVIIRERF